MRRWDITAKDEMKKLLFILAFIFSALCILNSEAQNFDGTVTVQTKDGDRFSPNTTCKVEGSSNNNIAILKDSYVQSWNGKGKRCKMRAFILLTQPSLGTTTVIIEVYDEYKRKVGTEVSTIYKGAQSSGLIELEVNKSDDPCGYYTLSILSASCKEPRPMKAPLNKPTATSNTEYVDLGLPSGTIWKNTNEYEQDSINEILLKYELSMPTKEQWQELIDYCTWTWEGSGIKITASNGNSIYLPSPQHHPFTTSVTYYWSSSKSKDNRYFLFFDENGVEMRDGTLGSITGKLEFVRLVKPINSEPEFVDLGLLSGTKWKSQNEQGFLTYEEAYSKYGDQIPTREQWQELKDKCKWENLGVRFIVTGPNGKCIYINKEGVCGNNLSNKSYIGKVGEYCTRTHAGGNFYWEMYLYTQPSLEHLATPTKYLSVHLVK